MDKYLTDDELHKIAEDKHVTAVELNILVTATQERTALREQELEKLKRTLAVLEEKLGIT